MGSTHFLMKRLPNVKTEIGLHILAYNLKRVIATLGVGPLIEAIRPDADLVARSRALVRLRPSASFYTASVVHCHRH
jgi:cyanate permease